jgi:hypothetical protein
MDRPLQQSDLLFSARNICWRPWLQQQSRRKPLIGGQIIPAGIEAEVAICQPQSRKCRHNFKLLERAISEERSQTGFLEFLL